MFIDVYKWPHCTIKAETVVDYSLTAIVALLVHPSGTIHLIVDFLKTTSSQK